MTSTDFTIRILGDSTKAVQTVEGFTKKLNIGTQKWSAASAAAAGAVGGAVSAIANRAMDALGSLVSEAAAASDSTDKFKQTLGFAGLDTSAIDKANSKAQAYADATVYDLGTIQNTTAQLAANGITNYSDLTEAAGNLNAVAGGNAETFKSVSMVLTQTAGQGKLTTENWNQLSDAIPGAAGKLQEALQSAGAYTGNFRDAMSKGEITADEFNAALLTLGNEPVAVEAATSTDTLEGALGNLQATIVGELAGAISSIKPMLTGAISVLSDMVSWAGKNKDVLLALGIGIGVAAGAYAVLTTALKLQTAYQVASAAATGGLTIAQWAWNAAMSANPIGLVVAGIALLIAAIVLLVQNWDQVVAWVTEIWAGFIGWITGVINGFIGWWNGVWTAIGRFVANIWNTWIVTPIRNAWNWVTNAIQTGLNLIKSIWEGTWNTLGSIVRGVWNGIIGWIEGGVNGAIDLINGMIRGVNSVGSAFGVHIDVIPKVRLPRLATGGVTTGPMMAIVGDNPGGREYIEPVDRVAERLERVAITSASGVQSGPLRIAREDLDYIAKQTAKETAKETAQALYPMIVMQTQKTVSSALG